MKKILLSRTDNIGDVVLTLPMARVLKTHFPQVQVYFLGKTYTQDIVGLCGSVDQFLNWDEWRELSDREIVAKLRSLNLDAFIHVFPQKRLAGLVKKAGVKVRIGTSNRLYHWLTCNRLSFFSRKRSELHEAQLNLKLLRPLGVRDEYTKEEIGRFYEAKVDLGPDEDYLRSFLSSTKFNLILHPLSNLSAQEWGLENFKRLAQDLDPNRFHLIVTGTAKEGERMREHLLTPLNVLVTDSTGKLSLSQLVKLISLSDGLLAASTGPLHIAACLGIHALGLYAQRPIIGPHRWAPLGAKAEFLQTRVPEEDLGQISVELVRARLESWQASHKSLEQ